MNLQCTAARARGARNQRRSPCKLQLCQAHIRRTSSKRRKNARPPPPSAAASPRASPPYPASPISHPHPIRIPTTPHSHSNRAHPHPIRISSASHPHPNRAACAVGGDLPLICAGARRAARRLDGCVGWRALVRLAAATRHGEGAAGTRWQTSARPAERLPHAGLAARAAQAATPSCDASGAGRSPGGA
jgi:hypothetical protein